MTPEGLAPGHPERLGGLGLALVDRDDPGPDDLGHVGALVQAEAQCPGHEGGHQHVGVDGDEAGPERDPEGQVRVEVGDPHVPEEELDQHRRPPEEPDVDPGRPGEQPVGGQAHHRQQHSDGDARHHGDDRQLQGDPDAAEDRVVEEVLPHHPPLEAAFAHPSPLDVGEEQGVDHHGHQHQHHGAGHPAPRVAHGDHRRGRRCGRPPRLGPAARTPAARSSVGSSGAGRWD